ncbi:MAG TPA: HEAT repeat domain-containing protein [Acidimicrobiales bacterium]|nr:HEAT repeat domain-containing protein [Acidimicrobiales bacterium]
MEPLADDLLRASFASDDDSHAVLLASVQAKNVRHYVLALRGLTRRSLMTPELWRQALSDPDVEIRRESLQLFAHDDLNDPDVLALVVSLLGDDDDLVVEGAAFALGEHLFGAAVVALCEVATSHEDARCRESAIAALGSIGDDRGRATILNALKDKPAIRRRAIVALSNFEGPDIEAALNEAGEDRDWQVRSAVTQLRNQDD